MPVSTVITYLGQSDEQFLEQMGQWCRQQIKKAKSKKLTFHIADDADRDEFYDVWQGVGSNKGFNVVPREEYDRLRHYLSTNKGSLFYNAWNLFVAKSEGKIVSGSIVIYDQDTLFYLYGGTDREFGNVGWHQYLMYQIMLWARDYGFSYFDLGGGAPTWYPHHPLANVSKFKEALGGTKVEYYGNFDLVFNPWLYRVFQWKRGGH
jgi:lipid II:glycine glycyltransferase (peptidoglycan interpeptide bridge formation enzyme)